MESSITRRNDGKLTTILYIILWFIWLWINLRSFFIIRIGLYRSPQNDREATRLIMLSCQQSCCSLYSPTQVKLLVEWNGEILSITIVSCSIKGANENFVIFHPGGSVCIMLHLVGRGVLIASRYFVIDNLIGTIDLDEISTNSHIWVTNYQAEP